MLLLAVLCTVAKRKDFENELDSAMKIRINRYFNAFNFRSWKYAKEWLVYTVAHGYKENGKKRVRGSGKNYASSNAENTRADNDTEVKMEKQTFAHFSNSFHQKVVHSVLKEENGITISKFVSGWIHKIKSLQNAIIPPLNFIEDNVEKRIMMEYLSKTAMKALDTTSLEQKMCQAATMLERYVCTLLSPEIIMTLDLDLASDKATYATVKKYEHCNELFNKDNSQWKRSLSLLGCLQKRDHKLLQLLSTFLQVKSDIIKAYPIQ